MTTRFVPALLGTTVLAGSFLASQPALAAVQSDGQVPPAPVNAPDTSAVPTIPQTVAPVVEGTPVPSNNAQGEPVRASQDIIVTGSRIPQPNLESASPVTVVTSQEVKLSGTSRTEDLINSLPQVFATQGSNIANGSSGTAEISLRGLGSKRSLVLINGKRLQAGDTFNPVADINFVPAVMIKRVDVLTGGASSVYGADAVAGVVNFILDTTFTGFRIDGQASVFNHYNNTNSDVLEANAARGFAPPHGWSTNGGAQDVAGMFGAAFDDGRGHVTAYATYRSQDPVLQSSRDYAFCALAGLTETEINSLHRRFKCGGSATSGTGTFLQYDPVTFALLDVLQVNGDQFVPGTTPFNFAPYNYFQRPDERYTFGAFADYEISDAFKPYAELMFMDDHSDAQIAPSGDFGQTTSIACDNAMLSAQQRARICAPDRTFVGSLNGQANVEQAFVYTLRRNVEGGGRDDDLRHTDYRLIGGLRGDPARGISYDAYYQVGRSFRNETYLNDFSVTRLGRAIDVVDDGDGNLVCRAALTGIDPNCVPYDVFRTGGVDQAALTYLQTPGFQRGLIDETIAHADFTVSGDEYGWRFPWAETGVGLNAGAEYRKERLDFQVDEAFRTFDLAGQGGPILPVKGSFDLRELFGEIQLPIVEHNFIDAFTITAGYRYSSYRVGANSFTTDTYKIAAELAPIPDIRFRASYNRAVRAPNIVELFAPQAIGLSGTIDPCQGPVGANGVVEGGATLTQCQLTGVTAAQYGVIGGNPANQYNALFGGNQNLRPEKADTLTLGVVLQPRFIPGLALTADYFDIKVKDLISAPAFQGVFDACFGGDSASCALVHRNPGNGSLWLGNGYVELTSQNFTGLGLFTKGIDVQGSYSRRLGGLGTLNLSLVGTYLSKLGTPTDSRPGTFAGSTPSPKWRHTARASLTLPSGLGASVRWRHFSGVNCVPGVDTECGSVANPKPADLRLSAQDYFDLTFTARLASRLNLRIGATNLFDREPPVTGQETIPTQFGQSANTYAQVYDSLGRYLFAGFTVDF
jgi:iron complex outermembrane receptor protein